MVVIEPGVIVADLSMPGLHEANRQTMRSSNPIA